MADDDQGGGVRLYRGGGRNLSAKEKAATEEQ